MLCSIVGTRCNFLEHHAENVILDVLFDIHFLLYRYITRNTKKIIKTLFFLLCKLINQNYRRKINKKSYFLRKLFEPKEKGET